MQQRLIEMTKLPATELRVKQKIKASQVAKTVLSRVVHPKHVVQAIQLQRNRKRASRSLEDVQLKLFSQVLPSDFLHFGFFENPDIAPEDMTLNSVVEAQTRYAHLLLDLIEDRDSPVMDVGCGMGGLCRMLLERGQSPIAVTPDRVQVKNIQEKYPSVPVIGSKFEQIDASQYEQMFGTVITSESLQYLKLDKALPLLNRILKKGGKWIACDFFYREPTHEKSCHVWDEFVSKVKAEGWAITFQRDITAHAAPTLRFVHMWATRFGIPLMHFAFHKFQKKQPGLHHLLHDALQSLESLANHGIGLIDPAAFVSKHQYMLLTLERAK